MLVSGEVQLLFGDPPDWWYFIQIYITQEHYITIIEVYSSNSETLFANTAFMVIFFVVKQVRYDTLGEYLEAEF